jgi:hypothetical protein
MTNRENVKKVKYDYLTYKQMRRRGELTLGIANQEALKYVKWLPPIQRMAITFWILVATLMIPLGLILGYLYSGWWLLLILASGVVWRANTQSVAEFVTEYADENSWFFSLVDGDNAWVYQSADGKLISGICSGDKHERAAVDDYEIINKYGSFLEASTLSPTCVEDDSELPFTKERIKTAIFNLLRSQSDKSTQDVLIIGLLSLPSWQHGVGGKRIGVSLELINSNQEVSEKAMAIHAAGQDFEKWKPIVNEETLKLIQELESMGINPPSSVSAGNVDRAHIQEAGSNPSLNSTKTSTISGPALREMSYSIGFMQTQPYGVPLDRLDAALKAANLATERVGNALIVRQEEITTKISVDLPVDRKTEDGAMIRAAITIRTELPSELSSVITKPKLISDLNRMTTIGALMIEDKRLVIGSRITLYEEEEAWDLQAMLVLSAALFSAQSMLGAFHRALTNERRAGDKYSASKWSDHDLEVVRNYLSKMSVCTAGKGGVTAEFGLHSGSISAVQGDQNTALWKLITDQPHPQVGGGLFCLLEMPHQASDADQLGMIVQQLNAREMLPLDLPPHFGAWCAGSLGNNPAYVTFLPNHLHDKQGIAVNVSFWAMARAQWANAMLASLALGVPARGRI